MTSYDEDISENPFHHHLLENHPDLLETISEKNWTLCIPRKGTLNKPLTRRDIYDHVLMPAGNSYRNLNDLIISPANDDCLAFNGSTAKILFKETFYTKHTKYRIFCIDTPINVASTDKKIVHLSNLKDCIDFLIDEASCEILNKINESCEAFLLEHENLHGNSLQDLRDLAQMLYTKCILLTLKGNFIRQGDRVLAFNFRVAIETYMQHCLNNQIFNAICTNTSLQDGKLNKRTRNLQNVQLGDLGVAKFQDTVSEAISEILKLNRCTTTMAKLMCLKNVFRIFSNKKLNADELVQLFTYLIIKSNVNNWIANLTLLQKFIFASLDSSNENAFLITTLEAAIEFIKSNILQETDCKTSHNKLFESIRNCDMESIEIILQNEDLTNTNYTLCHPLCTCDNCESALVSTNKFSLNWCDEKGRSALHIACLYGNPLLVDCFMRKGADITAVDYAGCTPCHYAAYYGHQNALLLLLHAGADSNVIDCEGNTPLHLACNNCHENCVKALLYYAEHKNYQLGVNRQNFAGDTALHLAACWGYISLIAILLQYGANYKLKNKKGKRAIDLTNNYNIKRIITEKKQDINFCESKSTEQLKKVELLLRAVENNDLPLSCFYLGIPVPSTNTKEIQKPCCHPLCNCRNTVKAEANFEGSTKQKMNINASNSEGITALHVAAKYGRKEILRLLLDAGANVNLRSLKFSYTPLHLACINQRDNIIKDILLCGSCNIDVQDYKGNTPLHHACFKNNCRIVELLLLQGSDITIRNDDARTALQVAEDMSLTNVFKIIKDKSNSAILIDD